MKNSAPKPLLGADGFQVSEFTADAFLAPNGLKIFQHSAAETKYVYEEIFEDRVYFRHGIDLIEGESIFDIGANIGLFTVFVKENFKGVKVHAFEPGPAVFRVLKANVAKYGDSVVVHDCGVADRPGEGRFTFYPNYSIMSGLHAVSDQDWEILRAGIRNRLAEQGRDPAAIPDYALDRMIETALGQKQEYVCRLRTVSEIIDEAGIPALGLLKIDAEGSELDILAGIWDEHWGRIRQVVMEIHDPKGLARLEVAKLLERQGYLCHFEEEKRFSGSGIVNCYARRG